MLENGLNEIKNPSSNFTNKENIAGLATTITLEGTRSVSYTHLTLPTTVRV